MEFTPDRCAAELRSGCGYGGGPEAFKKVVADPQRVRDDRQRRVYRGTGGEEAAINDIEIVEVVRFAIRIESRCRWIITEADCAVLMGNPGKGNFLSEEETPCKQTLMALPVLFAPDVIQRVLQLLDEVLMRSLIVGFIAQDNFAVAIQSHTIVGVRQILGREPEVE